VSADCCNETSAINITMTSLRHNTTIPVTTSISCNNLSITGNVSTLALPADEYWQ